MLKNSKFTTPSLSKLALFTLVLIGATISGSALAEAKNAATVNGVAIPQSRHDMRVKAAIAQGQPDSPETRKAVLDELINIEVLAQAANKKGLGKKAEVIQQIDLSKQTILASAYIQDYVKSKPLSDDALKQEYEKINKVRGNKEYKVSHILLKTEEDAKKVADQLKNSKFEDVAMDKSQDPGSSVKGEHGHAEAKGKKHGDEHAGERSVVRVAKEAIDRNDIRVEKAGAGRLGGGVDAPAEVMFQPDKVAHVTLLVPGRITSVKASLGDKVKRGDTLAVVESAELSEAQGASGQAQAALDVANPRAFRRGGRSPPR